MQKKCYKFCLYYCRNEIFFLFLQRKQEFAKIGDEIIKLDCQDLNQKEDMIFRVVTEQLCVIMFVVMLLFGGLPPATARAAKTNE